MASKKARTRTHKRDRRIAKASKWKREGRTKMGARVGHGASGGAGVPHEVVTKGLRQEAPPEPKRPRLTVRLGFFVDDEEEDEKEGNHED